jgi:Phosphoribosylanthranilate isomerase
MKRTLHPKVKVCCISSIAEAKMAMENGADAIGLVGDMPSGPGIINDDLIKEIANIVPPNISSFLLTSETTTTKIIEHHKKVNTTTIQIVDKLTKGNYEDLRNNLPTIDIVQVIHVMGEESIIHAKEISSFVDYLLLDSGNPNLKIKILGGTGNVHNWEISKRIRESVKIPIFLAGGLNSENIKEAINKVQPFGVDLCSGVRTNGNLDERKLKSFFDAVKN